MPIALALVFAAAFYLVRTFFAWADAHERVVLERLEDLRPATEGRRPPKSVRWSGWLQGLRRQVAHRQAERPAEVPQSGDGRRLRRLLRRAGLAWRDEEFIAMQVVAAGIGGTLLLLLGRSLLWVPLGALCGAWVPQVVVTSKVRRRLRSFEQQLPGALGMLANALRSGHAFLQSLEMVGQELQEPLAGEFRQVVREVRVNIAIEDALANLTDRVPSDDLDLMVTAVLIQRQVGGNLAEILDRIAETIRQRLRIQAEIRALTSQGRLSGMIVGALPIALMVLIGLVNPGYLKPLFTTPAGLAMLGVAAVMEAVGAVVIRSVVRVDV